MRAFFAITFSFLTACATYASGETYPSRPITIVVPYPAGGPTDTLARIVTERMQVPLGQRVIVENVSGAGGSIAVGRVVHAAPDGYTLSIGHVQTHVFNALAMDLPYDVVNDLEPVSLLADAPIWIVSRKSLPADELKGLIAWLRSSNGKATMGSVGVGGPVDVAARIFQKQTATEFQIIPYRGGAPLLQDLLGGQIDFAFGALAASLNLVHGGELKAFAVLSPKRWWAAPEVPTLDELGVPNIHASFWHGVWVPKGTAKGVIAKLNISIREALNDPAVQARLKDVGQEVWPRDEQTPEALAAKQKAEIERWSPVIKELGIKAE